jgi:hypothetical protein
LESKPWSKKGQIPPFETLGMTGNNAPYDPHELYRGRQDHRHRTVRSSGCPGYRMYTGQLAPVEYPNTGTVASPNSAPRDESV